MNRTMSRAALVASLVVMLATAPGAEARRADIDRDGMPNAFERTYRLNPRARSDARKDPDRDRLSNRAEYRARTNPRRADTDGDGRRDGWEVAAGRNPRDPRDGPRKRVQGPGRAPVAPVAPIATPDPGASPPAPARANTQPVGFRPLDSAAAAQRVLRRSWEPRPRNAPYAHPPTAAELAYFHRWDGRTDDCELRAHVDGGFSGTTDETLQWTAHKWGLDEDVVRAQMQAETTWDHAAWIARPGDGGQSFGLSQIKVTVHPGFVAAAPGDGGSAAGSMSLNADYYGYVTRAAMNGCEGWLADYDAAERAYPPRDADEALWGAVGRWYSGEWWTSASDGYRATVRRHLAERAWATASWFYGAAGPWPG
jgi:hypothetical protein